MYKGDKEVMANTYDDNVKYDKMGYMTLTRNLRKKH